MYQRIGQILHVDRLLYYISFRLLRNAAVISKGCNGMTDNTPLSRGGLMLLILMPNSFRHNRMKFSDFPNQSLTEMSHIVGIVFTVFQFRIVKFEGFYQSGGGDAPIPPVPPCFQITVGYNISFPKIFFCFYGVSHLLFLVYFVNFQAAFALLQTRRRHYQRPKHHQKFGFHMYIRH